MHTDPQQFLGTSRMKTEKIVISFIAVIIGILAAGIVFYFYQTTKIVPPSKSKPIAITAPTPTPATSVFVTLDTPRDEQVVDTKTITLTGKTAADAIITVATQAGDQVVTPAQTGSFSVTITLSSGESVIYVTAIAPDGQEASIIRTVTYSIESF